MDRSKRALTTLTDAEARAWQQECEYQITTGQQGQDKAAERAWRAIQRQFPRLLRYQGARP